MAIQPLQLPPLINVPQVDFSPLSQLGDIYKQGLMKRELQEAVTQAGGKPDLAALGTIMLKHGNVEGYKSLAQLAHQQQISSPQHAADIARARAGVEAEFAPKTTNIKTPEGEEVTVEKGPSGYRVPQVQGLAPSAAGAGTLPFPVPPGLTGKQRQTYIEARLKQVANIDDKAVASADDAATSGKNAISILGQALNLNDKAFSGPLAGTRGYLASNFRGGSLDPSGGKVKERGDATETLTNLITSQALETLKATFGGMPTEGERKVLLDIQGSPARSPEVRKEIFERARTLAAKRVQENTIRARQMREGTFLLPGGGTSAPADQPASQAADPLAQARDAIAKGASKEAVIQRLRERGIDPAGL